MGLDREDFSISTRKNTIKDRIRSNRTKATRGPLSPASEIESIITTFARYRQEAGQPMMLPLLLIFNCPSKAEESRTIFLNPVSP
jgi:hypothetical protein